MQGVPHVPPAESSDDEGQEPGQDTQAAEEYHEQQVQQEGQSAGHAAQDTARAQVKTPLSCTHDPGRLCVLTTGQVYLQIENASIKMACELL